MTLNVAPKKKALVSALNLPCKLSIVGLNQQVQVLFTSVIFCNERRHGYGVLNLPQPFIYCDFLTQWTSSSLVYLCKIFYCKET